ncbi:uncharacterized [Tachysurus ichikawai]
MWPIQTEKSSPAELLLALMLSATKADGCVPSLQAFLVTFPLHHSLHLQKMCVLAISPPPSIGFLLPFRLQASFCQGKANYWSVHHCWQVLNGTQQSKSKMFKGIMQKKRKAKAN